MSEIGDNQRITNYEDFFPYYLREHSKPVTRALHYAATVFFSGCFVALAVTGNIWFLPVAVVSGYGLAWTGHFGFEKNRPATFDYPYWSFISDFRMFGLWISGRLAKALDEAGVE